MPPQVWLRGALLVTLVGIPLLALLALRRREVSFVAFLRWGLLALLLPLVGGFLVLLWGPRRRGP